MPLGIVVGEQDKPWNRRCVTKSAYSACSHDTVPVGVRFKVCDILNPSLRVLIQVLTRSLPFFSGGLDHNMES